MSDDVMQAYRIQLTTIGVDGSPGPSTIVEHHAADSREAMAAIVRQQEGWFSLELLNRSVASRSGSCAEHHTRDTARTGESALV